MDVKAEDYSFNEVAENEKQIGCDPVVFSGLLFAAQNLEIFS
jgi:hypothetical protein